MSTTMADPEDTLVNETEVVCVAWVWWCGEEDRDWTRGYTCAKGMLHGAWDTCQGQSPRPRIFPEFREQGKIMLFNKQRVPASTRDDSFPDSQRSHQVCNNGLKQWRWNFCSRIMMYRKHRIRRFGRRTTYMGKTRKCSSTTRSILISKAFDASISMATVHSHIRLHAKEKKNILYLFPDMFWMVSSLSTFLVRWFVFFMGK